MKASILLATLHAFCVAVLILTTACGQISVQPSETSILATVTPKPTDPLVPTQTLSPVTLSTATLPAGLVSTRELDGMVMVYISAGPFEMGRSDVDGTIDSPGHVVDLDGYWIDQHEVTNSQYARCVSLGVCQPPEKTSTNQISSYYGNPAFDFYPVVWVNWHQAAAYCAWAGARLPTEAEWEKAARGTNGAAYPWGDMPPDKLRLNFNTRVPVKVGGYPAGASPYGVMDMAGNVWEWVADWFYGKYYQQSPSDNPTGPETGKTRVQRGGAWDEEENGWSVRITQRFYDFPESADFLLGFRCAKSN